MSPAQLFSLAILITAAAAAGEMMLRRIHRARLGELASQWRMNYSPLDQFRLTPRVARNFPVPGAAKIRVVDLIYGIDRDVYRYVFTAEYTAGVVSHKKRIQRAASFSEPRDRRAGATQSSITLAPTNLPLLDQYRKLTPPCARQEKTAPDEEFDPGPQTRKI